MAHSRSHIYLLMYGYHDVRYNKVQKYLAISFHNARKNLTIEVYEYIKIACQFTATIGILRRNYFAVMPCFSEMMGDAM